MRFVHRNPAPRDAGESLLPTAEELEDVRFLSKRFEGAGLRPVRLLPVDLRQREATIDLEHLTEHERNETEPKVWLALESMQITGSFKVRGAMHAVARRLLAFRRRPDHTPAEGLVVVAASAGNHGVGVAHAAKHLGARAEIVVPSGAARTKIQKIEAAGAKVIVSSSPGYDEAEREAMALAEERGAAFISPYDDMDVLVGNGASLGFEIMRALGRVPGVVYCPIGGGGLATGLACAVRHELRAHEDRDLEASPRGVVIPVQSEASCAFATSLGRDAAVTELPPAPTIAEGLEGGISERAFARARTVIDRAVVCEEAEIEDALRWSVRNLGLIVEGSAAVALVPPLHASAGPTSNETADTVIVLTGRNIDIDRLTRVLSV